MSDPTTPETDPRPADDRSAPWGHSRAAHRVHGICSHCRGYSVEEEVIAWRTHENKRHDRQEAALAASEAQKSSHLDLASTDGRPCPSCGREALIVVTVTLVADGERRPAGGWAVCAECGATPHPTMQEAADG